MISLSRGGRAALAGGILSGLVAAYCLAPVLGDITIIPDAESEGAAMVGKTERETGRRSAAIPPIDASTRGATETATFALG